MSQHTHLPLNTSTVMATMLATTVKVSMVSSPIELPYDYCLLNVDSMYNAVLFNCHTDLGSVGDGSCVGYFACRNAIGELRLSSCSLTIRLRISHFSLHFEGYVGDGSCNGDFACDRLQGKVTQFVNLCVAFM